MLRPEAPHVVILGAGFAGLAAAKALRNAHVKITLIDRSNHHLFQPLLYQVASAALAAPSISTPIRKILRHQQNAAVWMANVRGVDVENKRVLLEGGTLDYDYLIVATGMTHAYFGHDTWAEHAPGLKTIGEALGVRGRILRAFEAAELESQPEQRRAWTTFVIIGGGPTGVELAGAVAEIAGRTLARDFRSFDPRTTRVILVEAGARVLPTFSEYLSRCAREQLEHLGIEVRTGQPVSELGPDFVQIGEERIAAQTIVWAAGVQASPIAAELGAPTDRAGRVLVEDDLSLPGHPEVFVLGDLISKQQDGKPLPGVAQLALQSGVHVAKNLRRELAGHERLPFRYVDKGSMATIGRNKAVAQVGRMQFSGILAWMLWLFVHIAFLVEFRNRIGVLFQWAWAYLTWQRGSRVIVDALLENSQPMAAAGSPALRGDASEREFQRVLPPLPGLEGPRRDGAVRPRASSA
ncbi:MAG TPA: NAD(P)/FAD-dependent oxidoreductase [Polyangiales bacterium]|nr:NAD(P)/FAD-dependent oxidoreductase [Polyangiales bacterium]